MTGRTRSTRSCLALLALAVAILVVPVVASSAPPAAAQTCSDTLVGEGGSTFEPVIDALLINDTASLSPLCPSYTNPKLDNAIADFVGTSPGDFDADYVLSERALTSTESSLAQSNGRSFAYVPFAATPVAIATLVPTASWGATGSTTINSSDFCQMSLTVDDLGEIYGFDAASPFQQWSEDIGTSAAPLQCSVSGQSPNSSPLTVWANGDPTMENEALMTLLDSTSSSKGYFDAGLQKASAADQASTTSDTPSESWPYLENTIPGGDQPLIGKLLNVNPTTNVPDTDAENWQLGSTLPISSVWTGAPLGVAWNLPTAAIQNAQGAFVAPSEKAAAAAQADATLASTSDPTTNSIVTFTSSSTDAVAYNSDLMLEEYLVVPTNTLPADKATALSQLIRFVLGPTGQSEIEGFGAAPATPAMVTAGLKVAAQLSALGLSEAATTTSTSAAASTTADPSSTATTSADSGGSGATATASDSGSGGQGGSSLASTGSNPVPLVGVGVVLILIAVPIRRRLLRRTVALQGSPSGGPAGTREEGR
jgi:hypothetical protein